MKKIIWPGLLSLSLMILIVISGSAITDDDNLEKISYNSSSEIIEIDIEIPRFRDDFSQAARYNQEFINNALDFAFEMQEMAARDFESFEGEDWGFRTYNAAVRYNLQKYNDLISLTFSHYRYTGGAHGITSRFSYNIDKETGEQLNLKEFLERTELNLEDINYEIQEEIEANPADYHSGLDFTGIREDHEYYLKDSALVIYFQLYEIAPYAFGFPEFEIKY